MPEIVPDNTDYSEFVGAEPTATVAEFIAWLRKYVPYKKFDDESINLAIRLYGYFQRSESHQNALANRRAEREADLEPEPEPAPVKPARRGKVPAAAPTPEPAKAAGRPARRGKPAPPPEPEPEPTPARAARRGRRPASEDAAPY